MKINTPQTALTSHKVSELIGNGKSAVKVTILHVADDSNDRKQYALLFEESDDRLYLNVTNLRAMIAKFGDESQDWVGETIELYIVKVDVDGTLRSGVRLR